jgi:hypothetical protein
MALDGRHDLLFVAGGSTRQAYVYSTRSTASSCRQEAVGGPNASNQISRIRLKKDLSAGVVVKVTSDLFQTPSTAARFGKILAVVNAKFDTGSSPTAHQYEVVLVRA